MLRAMMDELEKLGAVDAAQARTSLDRLDTLERNKPTAGQALRYGTLGAGAGLATGAISDVIQGRKLFKPEEGVRFGRPRAMLARAAAGAVGSGMIPLARYYLDRQAEMGKLKEFMGQQPAFTGQEPGLETKVGGSVILPDGSGFFTGTVGKPKGKEKDANFAVSSGQGTSPMSYGPVNLRNDAPPFTVPSLRSPVVKQADVSPSSSWSGNVSHGPTVLVDELPPFRRPSLVAPLTKSAIAMIPRGDTPAARLASSKAIAGPNVTGAPGESIAQQSKPRGYGMKLEGCTKHAFLRQILHNENAADLAGLGMMTAGGVDNLQSKLTGGPSVLGEQGQAATDVAGLGVMALPHLANMAAGRGGKLYPAAVLGGLGALAAPTIDRMQAKWRASPGEDPKSKQLMSHKAHELSELAGYGIFGGMSLHDLAKNPGAKERALNALHVAGYGTLAAPHVESLMRPEGEKPRIFTDKTRAVTDLAGVGALGAAAAAHLHHG